MIDLAQESLPNLYLANPLQEAPLASFSLPALPANYTLLTADGSQIVPSRHRALQFGLINIGILTVRFGSGQPPAIKLISELLDHVDTFRDDGSLIGDDDIALVRDLRERSLIREGSSPDLPRPVLTVTDGPLDIFYRSDIQGKKAQTAQKEVYQLDQQLEQEGILSAGYIDKPGSAMLHNMLDVFNQVQGNVPLQQKSKKIRVSDRLLLSDRNAPGDRSALSEIIS